MVQVREALFPRSLLIGVSLWGSVWLHLRAGRITMDKSRDNLNGMGDKNLLLGCYPKKV